MKSILIRSVLGETLREVRIATGMTLRDVSTTARVSLGYLSEVERGHKEASSELVYSISCALGISVSDLLAEVSRKLALREAPKLAAVA